MRSIIYRPERPARLYVQDAAQRIQEQQHVRRRRPGSHESDAPDASRERTEPRPDLDVELGEQTLADGRLVDAVGHHDGVQGPQPFGNRRQQSQAHRFETGYQRQMLIAVSPPPRFEAFLGNRNERLAKGVDQWRGYGVVI